MATGTEAWVLPGVDIPTGLRRMVGKPALFEKALCDFYVRFHGEAAVLQQLKKAGDKDLLRQRVHTFKGLAGSVSATDLFVVAQQMDFALKNGADIDTLLDLFECEIDVVMEGIARQFHLLPAASAKT